MKDEIKQILENGCEELEKLKMRINYGVAEHVEHSCTFCYKQILYDDIEMCDATDKWFETEAFGICEKWERVPRAGN